MLPPCFGKVVVKQPARGGSLSSSSGGSRAPSCNPGFGGGTCPPLDSSGSGNPGGSEGRYIADEAGQLGLPGNGEHGTYRGHNIHNGNYSCRNDIIVIQTGSGGIESNAPRVGSEANAEYYNRQQRDRDRDRDQDQQREEGRSQGSVAKS